MYNHYFNSSEIYSLAEEVERLRVMFAVLTTLTCLSLLAILYLLGRTLIRWEKIQKALRTAFTKSWIKVR